MTASAEPSGGPSGGDNEPKPPQPTAGEDFEDEEDENEEEPEQPAADGKAKGKKKKRSKRKAIKDALTGGAKTPADASGESSATRGDQASARGIQELLKNNPSLEKEFAGMSPDKVEEMLKKMNSMGGKKNKKDMASYKFWQTQPVPRF
ncbi:MAG: glycylpeptide N-tetradecanoyltransferase, partial [Thelocarpon superellum]